MIQKNKFLITAALPYANGPLHFGHIAGAYLPADCYCRFLRLCGKNALYVCGSDEHGVAITLSAELENRTPQEHVDKYHNVIKNFFEKLNIHFDHFSRTTWPGHAKITQAFFLQLLENGYIEERVTDQLYSNADNRFLADRYVEGGCPKCKYEYARGDECPKCGASYEATDLINPRSKITKATLSLKSTKHWFLRFDLFKDQLNEWISKKSWKPNVQLFAKNYIDDLKPRAITRDSEWGIPVPLPNTEGKVFYVWFDAPIGYISSTMEWAEKIGDKERWKDYWFDKNTKLINFIGKDNIPFHAVFFPAMIMGQNAPYKIVDELPANEFFNYEGKQFSKSHGWYIDLESFFDHFSTDQIRYVIAANAPETQDSEFTWKDFQIRCNSELVGKYGNLVNRIIVFAHSKCGGVVPQFDELLLIDKNMLSRAKELCQEIYNAFSNFQLRKASQLIMELAQNGNVYFDQKKPWKEKQTLNTTIYCSLNILLMLALTSYPIMPNAAQQLWSFLGFQSRIDSLNWNSVVNSQISVGQKLLKPTVLFKKVEDDVIEEMVHDLKKK